MDNKTKTIVAELWSLSDDIHELGMKVQKIADKHKPLLKGNYVYDQMKGTVAYNIFNAKSDLIRHCITKIENYDPFDDPKNPSFIKK
jgi:hypothetical protein